MGSTVMTDKTLLEGPEMGTGPEASQIVRVARSHGVSPLRQLYEMTVLRLGQSKLRSNEYFAHGLYDPSFSMAKKKEFVGTASNRELNQKMSPDELVRSNDFISNKALYTALIRQLGLPTTETQAIVDRRPKFGELKTLLDATAVKSFLLHDARYPLFGKPSFGSLSVGSVLITSVDAEQGELCLGNGRRVGLEMFCREVIEKYHGGYLFQTALSPHPVMQSVSGAAIGTVRVVTVIEESEPRPLYSVWKIPSPNAMSDNFWQDGSMLAQINVETGIVGRCRRGSGLDGHDIETHPVSGATFKDLQLPVWSEVLRVACAAHAVFPEFGIIGWDMAVTPEGPVIVESNDNPAHALFQLANCKGIKNPEFQPVFDRVATRAEGILGRYKAGQKARNKGS